MGPRCAVCHDREQDGLPLDDVGRIHDLGPGVAACELPGGTFLLGGPNEPLQECGLGGHREPVTWPEQHLMGVSYGGRYIVVGAPGRLVVRQWPGGEVIAHLPALWGWLGLSPSGRAMAFESDQGVTVWSPDGAGVWAAWSEFPGARSLVWSADEQRVALIGPDGIRILRPDGQEMPFVEGDAAAPAEGWVRSWERVAGRFTADGLQFSLVWEAVMPDPPGRTVAIARWGWDGRRWSRQPSLRLETRGHFSFSPDGRWLAVASRLVEVVDLVQGMGVGRVGLRPGAAWQVHFSLDGRSLLICHGERLCVVPWALLLGV